MDHANAMPWISSMPCQAKEGEARPGATATATYVWLGLATLSRRLAAARIHSSPGRTDGRAHNYPLLPSNSALPASPSAPLPPRPRTPNTAPHHQLSAASSPGGSPTGRLRCPAFRLPQPHRDGKAIGPVRSAALALAARPCR
jgi:hypothetical protein